MAQNQFSNGTVTVQFATPPSRDSGTTPTVSQATGYDSSGTLWCYDHGTIIVNRYSLVFPRVSATVMAQVRAFFSDTVHGSRDTFTWYDHTGAARTVFLAGEINSTPLANGYHRLQLRLDEEVAWAPPTFPNWETAKNATSAAPVWILKLTINAVAYYLSGSAVTVPAWSITTQPWVKSFGAIQEGITNGLAEFRVSDLTVDLISDPASGTNMVALATSYPLEKSAAELYLGYPGVLEAPHMVFRGYVRDIDIPNEFAVTITIEDESSRLQQYVGTKIDRTTYPNADPDDVGKVIPIVFGTVTRLPALAVDAGIMTTLTNAISATTTTVIVSDATGINMGNELICDAESMYVIDISGNTLTVARAMYGTTAVIHNRGAAIWQNIGEFRYLVADHPVTSINNVYGKVGEKLLDITAVCTLYPSGNYPTYPGKAVVTVPGYITVEQAINLLITDGIQVKDSTRFFDEIRIGDSMTLHDEIVISDSITVVDPGHLHNTSVATSENVTSTMPSPNSTYQDGLYGLSWPCYVTISYPADGARATASYSITIRPKFTNNGVRVRAYQSGVAFYDQTYNMVANSLFNISFAIGGNDNQNYITVVFTGYSVGMLFDITSASRTIQLTSNNSSSNTANVAKSGNAYRTNNVWSDGGAYRQGSAYLQGNAYKYGSVTVSGNSVANTVVCDQLLVNVTRSFASPTAALQSLLTYAGSSMTLTLSGTLPASYALNGAITEYRTCLEWLNIIAFQLRSWFRVDLGVARLIVRPDTLTSTRTIAACRISDDGRKVHHRKKAQLIDVVNKINLLYDRDWSMTGTDAYRQVSKSTNATSIADFGVRERPELFQCDFITSTTMASSVRDFYLTWSGKRPWLHEIETYLDNIDIAFGTTVTLGFAGNIVGQVIEFGPVPGADNRIDTVKFTVIS